MVPTINVPETLLATADELIDWRHVAPPISRPTAPRKKAMF